MRKGQGLADYHLQAGEGLPLFTNEPIRPPEPVVKVDPDERLRWSRRLLLLSDLETFTAEDVRELVAAKRPGLLGSGRWLGDFFRHDYFTHTSFEQAQRKEAKKRWIQRWTLTEAGRNERARLRTEGPHNPLQES